MGNHVSKSEQALEELKSHPNYEDKKPRVGETLVQFTLRCVAHLVSPPMVPGESNEVECVDLRDAILLLDKEIQRKWNTHVKKLEKSAK